MRDKLGMGVSLIAADFFLITSQTVILMTFFLITSQTAILILGYPTTQLAKADSRLTFFATGHAPCQLQTGGGFSA